ncbi:MAG: dihydrolipoamide acetyltransferase family protein [Phycisphaerales bacterium]|jgi:pyruvate dehydrogenase E2 component (dihydrolipoamide acetyltransferase)|nr:dihydrolipoamide acetyltransferase family protein [Phycisphaerales bacterium]
MPIEITMPRLSDTMEEGTLLHWHKNVGDAVASGDVIADIETDKATMELQSFDDGALSEILVEEGEKVPVGKVIATLTEEDEASVRAPEAPAAPTSIPKTAVGMTISPVAKRLADEYGVDLKTIQGSGPSGRIIKRDILQVVDTTNEMTAAAATTKPEQVSQPVVSHTEPEVVASSQPIVPASEYRANRSEPLSNMRQVIAKRLVESKQTIPHYQVTMSFDMDPLLDMRITLNQQLVSSGVKLSVNDFLVRCCALAMAEHPAFNASFGGDCIYYHGPVNVGIAIALPEESGGGLVVGTIRDADQKSLRAISQESARLGKKAKEQGLSLEEMSDTTFTISNLGMFGVEHFTAIINPPNSAILAVGAAVEKPVVRDGELVVGNELSATLSLDHRVIDGAMAARYLKTLKELIENPAALLV